jgi:hypothetical protein
MNHPEVVVIYTTTANPPRDGSDAGIEYASVLLGEEPLA